MKRKFIVITDNRGEILGTQVAQDPTRRGVFAHIVAGAGQMRHEIETEIELPRETGGAKDIARFHADVKTHLQSILDCDSGVSD